MVRPHLIGLVIHKMTGSGNDFAMLDGRVTTPDEWTAADIRAVCARGTGVGADGVVFVSRGSDPGAVRMVYFNSDGSRAAMCGNAALCSTRFAARLGIAPGPDMRLETDAGTYETRAGPGPSQAAIRLGAARGAGQVAGVELGPGEQRAALATIGVPHLVVLVEDLEVVDVVRRGRELRHHPALGREGANVNFIARAPEDAGWRMRTYERGVEGETLACGTGAVAAACALDGWGLAELPVVIGTRSGRRLEVRGRRANRPPDGNGGGRDGTPEETGYEDLWLVGEARLVFKGVLT